MPRSQLITGGSFRGLLLVLAASLTVFAAAEAEGATCIAPAPEPDTFEYRSELVIEGRITDPSPSQWPNSSNVRITAVYRGSVKVGQTIVVMGLSDYKKSHGTPATSTVPLGPKDDLLLFLQKTTSPRETYLVWGTPNRLRPPSPPNGEAFELVDDYGFPPEQPIRLFVRGKVYNFYVVFGVWSAPRFPTPPYVAVSATAAGGAE